MTEPIHLRPGTSGDINKCGEICWNAFNTISRAHNFPPDFPNVDIAIGLMKMLFSQPQVYSVVAEIQGAVVGSNFLWEADPICGIGPLTVEPGVQNQGTGKALMKSVLERAASRNVAGVRLVQAAFHNRSLSLYTKLGFEVREPLAVIQGPALKTSIQGITVRPALAEDLAAGNRLCRAIHGHDRGNELRGAIEHKTAVVAERAGRITAYSTGIGFFGHAVAESNDDLKAMIAASPEFAGPGFLLPTRNTDVFLWCLEQGLQVTQPLSLMSRGLYNEPKGAFLPSILF